MNWSFLTKTGFWGKASFSQKKLLWILMGIAGVVVVYHFLIVPLVEAKKKADLEIDLNQRLLSKYAEILQNRKTIEESIEKISKQNDEIEKRLLFGETF